MSERMFDAIASEKVLARDWSSKEDEKAWKNLSSSASTGTGN